MSMFWSQLRVEQRIFWRNRSGVFFTFVLPLAMLVALCVSGDSVNAVPFVAALAVLSAGFQGLAIQLAMHREQGVLKRIMATPLPITTLIGAKAASVFIVVAIEMTAIVALAVAFFDAPVPENLALLILLVVVGTACFTALGFALAAIIPNSDAAPAMANAAYLGLLALTGVLAGVDSLPDAVREIGHYLPLYELLDGVDRTWLGAGANLVRVFAVLAAWGVVGVLVTSRWFRWEPAGER